MMKFTEIARDAIDGIDRRWRIVAVLVNKKPLSVACNDPEKTHPVIHKQNPAKRLHAEIRCIRNAPITKVAGSVLYVWRFNTFDQIRLSKPCDICMGFLKEMQVKKVVYSIFGSTYGKLSL